MNQPTQPTQRGSSVYTWIVLLLGLGIIGLVIWDVTRDSATKNRRTSEHGNVIELNKSNWEKEVVDSNIPVLVDFWAPWCGPCLQLAPTIEKLSVDYVGRVKFCKVNVDDEQELAAQFGISGLPTLLILKKGKFATQPIEGRVPERKLTQVLDAVLQAEQKKS